MPHSLWKGAISFGLVHIPVALYPASREDAIDFDWLDSRSMDPVGYKRINKRTGKEITKEHIVKGVKYEDDRYVVLSDEEIKQAYPKTTQTIEIEAFVKAQDIPFVHLERPYYLAPIAKGEKVYALLRETLLASKRIGIARVVIQTKEHLAALIPVGPALMLNTLRWPAEIRPWDELKLPAEGAKAAGLSERELSMASQLVDDMSANFDPSQYSDRFRDAVMGLIETKAQAGQLNEVKALESEDAGASSNVIDLTELLKRSLNKGSAPGDQAAAPKPAAKKAAPRKGTGRAPARKRA
ncbi:Ku protein [Aquabacterium sp.]|uniref:non-homologous end joining protein Ku n=1 Tax=Aquabacterium sp. TaxID=1872578 RepID=UPI00248A7149|nr:Ku protein [Aquabacterium sp.]MDI1261298.1 Ku protein [Aquabacterium sp.]